MIGAVGSFAVAGIALLVGAIWFSGPHLTAELRDGGWRISGRLLGEYDLGFKEMEIRNVSTRAVICEVSGSTTADVLLRRGRNTPEGMFGPGVRVQFKNGLHDCELDGGQRYEVTVWGNNGSGHVRASAIEIQF
jgi:hypothetical protein